jgi:predicted MFS family arabinose efflux permease
MAPTVSKPLSASAVAAPMERGHPRRWLLLAILFLVGTSSATDRVVISVLLDPIKREFGVSDTQLGLLSGMSFALLYSVLGLPIARWADRGDRRRLITIALSVWSGMTVACATVTGFWQLLIARIGVGAGEAGATPPTQALLVEYFPARFRARAIAIFATSGTVGYLLGLTVGSQLVSHYGWRETLVAFGLPGFLIAALAYGLLDEPRRTGRAPRAETMEDFRSSLRRLAAKPAFVRLLVGHTIYNFAAYGALLFVPTYLTRVLGVPVRDVGLYYGLTTALGVLLGSVVGGWLCDALVRRDKRWIAWFPAAGFALATVPDSLMFLSDDFSVFLWLSLLGGMLLNAALPAAFAAVHAVCGNARRATAIALVLFAGNLLGFGLGPTVTGALSDVLSSHIGVDGLRYAVLVVMALTLPTAAVMYSAARALPADIEA